MKMNTSQFSPAFRRSEPHRRHGRPGGRQEERRPRREDRRTWLPAREKVIENQKACDKYEGKGAKMWENKNKKKKNTRGWPKTCAV